VPMSELSILKQFTGYTNLVFPGAALFLVCTDGEFKCFIMELITAFLQDEDCRSVYGAQFVGRNVSSSGDETWVLSPTAQIHPDGSWIEPSNSQFVWLTTPGSEQSVSKSLACSVQYPLDDSRALQNLYSATEAFMPDNSIACLATMACCVMGATYQEVIRHCGHIGVPFLFGEPGSCKTEAIRCALALFGAHESHFFNSQTTAASFLFDVLKRTTIPVAIDDISEKAQGTWEELIIDTYNNTARGTRAYSVEHLCTLPLVSANWRFPGGRGGAFTRCITIPFVEHRDEPNATQLFSELVQIRDRASASVGVLVKCCSELSSQSCQDKLHGELFANISAIYQNVHARFKSTMTTFMYFFLKVNVWV